MAREGRSFPLLVLALALLAAGGVLGSSSGTGAYLPRLLLLSGAAGLVWAFVRAIPTLRVFSARMRTVAEPGPAFTWVLLAAIFLVLAIGMNLRHTRIDLTSRGLQSLSATSRKALAGVTKPIEMIGVFRDGSAEQAQARDLLEVYGMDSRKIRTRLFDPERDPDQARSLGIRFKSGVLIRADSTREVVTELTESALTQGILRAADPARPVVGIVESHGEIGPPHAGLSRFRALLSEGGFRAVRLDLSVPVPQQVRAVLILGPQAELLPGEVRNLDTYARGGGGIGVCVDPEGLGGLKSWLAFQGVEADGRPIRDTGPLTRSAGLGPETIAVQSLGQHDLTSGLTSAILLRGATRVGLSATPVWGSSGAEILKSAPSARLVGDAPDSAAAVSDKTLPMGVALSRELGGTAGAAAGVPEKKAARLVVIGDSDFLRDDSIDLYGNRAFASALVSWLGRRELLLSFPEPDASGTPLRVGLNGLRTIFYLVELLPPVLMLGLGLLVWSRRR